MLLAGRANTHIWWGYHWTVSQLIEGVSVYSQEAGAINGHD